MATFPTFGVGAYVNTDTAPTEDSLNEPGAFYYSDWATWGFPAAVYYIPTSAKFIAVWANQYFDGAVMGFNIQCRYLYPTSPITMGDVVTLYNMEVTRTLRAGEYRGAAEMYTYQQVMFNATIGDSLYLSFACDTRDESSVGQVFNYDIRSVILRIDCSGATPVNAAEYVEQTTGTYPGSGSKLPLYTVSLYHLASVAGKLLIYPHFAGYGQNSYFKELDENLDVVWQQESYPGAEGEVIFVASSDTSAFWLMTWASPHSAILCDYTGSGVTFQEYGPIPSGLPAAYYEYVEVATTDLYPMKRGFEHDNAMIIANYGYAAHNVWREGSQMFAEPMVFKNETDGDFGELGEYTYDDGPSYGYGTASLAGKEQYVTFYPTLSDAPVYPNEFQVNVGWDVVAERQNMVDDIGGYWFLTGSYSPACSAAQSPSGTGIILMRSEYPQNELGSIYLDSGTEPMGKIKAIPFFLGAPNLTGEYEASRRQFWRNNPY